MKEPQEPQVPNEEQVIKDYLEGDQPEVMEKTYYKPPEDKGMWAFDNNRLFWELKANLMGGHLTQDKNGYYVIYKRKQSEPMMNKTGIEMTMALFQGYINNVNRISNYDVNRVMDLCRHAHYDFAFLFYKNMDNFQVTPEKASSIISMLMQNVESCLRGSIDGATLRVLQETERTVISRQEQVGNKKLLGFIPMPGG